jgi:hypothetical protein|tara:strand:+ start:1734 stop:1898 length:165 start_codon:yes stop_codon:yes gene_type:complete
METATIKPEHRYGEPETVYNVVEKNDKRAMIVPAFWKNGIAPMENINIEYLDFN